MRKAAFLPAILLAAAVPAVLQAAPDAPAPAASAVDPALTKVLADPRRDKDRARDIWRHPAETITFFRIKPDMVVADYMPSSGWYTRVLAPYLAEKGQYIGITAGLAAASGETRDRLAAFPAQFPPKAAAWTGLPAERIPAYTLDAIPAERKGTVDRVMIMREVHNMWPDGYLYNDLAAIRSLLKDDGLLGIEEHRAKADAPASYTLGINGYMREADVIALIEAHGFKLVAKSEINANPKDPANWPNGVWTLPPVLTLKDQDRAKYEAIGESDRMTLLFAKRP